MRVKINKSKIKFLVISILLSLLLSSCSSRMTQEQINRITSGEHGFLVFTFPVLGLNDSPLTALSMVKRGFNCEVNVDGEKYFSDKFLEAETYKIPIPVGKHKVKYRIGAMEGTYLITIYLTGIDSGDSVWGGLQGNFAELDLDVNKDQIISVNMETVGEKKISWLNTLLRYGFPLWTHRMEAKVEVEGENVGGKQEVVSTKDKKALKQEKLGKIFSVNGEKVEIMRGSLLIKSGNIFHVFNKNKVAGKIVITEVFHTKAKAKIITSEETISTAMEFGRLN